MDGERVRKEEFSLNAVSGEASTVKGKIAITFSDELVKPDIGEFERGKDGTMNDRADVDGVIEKVNGKVMEKEPVEENSNLEKLKKGCCRSSDDFSVSSDMSSSSSDEEISSNQNKWSDLLGFEDLKFSTKAVNDFDEDNAKVEEAEEPTPRVSTRVLAEDIKLSRLSDDSSSSSSGSSSSSDSLTVNSFKSINANSNSRDSIGSENSIENMSKFSISKPVGSASFEGSISNFSSLCRNSNSFNSESSNCRGSSNLNCNDRINIERTSKNVHPRYSKDKDIVSNVFKRKLSLSSESSDSENSNDHTVSKSIKTKCNSSNEISVQNNNSSGKFTNNSSFSDIKSDEEKSDRLSDSTCNEFSVEHNSRSPEKNCAVIEEQSNEEIDACIRLPKIDKSSNLFGESRKEIEVNERHADDSIKSVNKLPNVNNSSRSNFGRKFLTNSISTVLSPGDEDRTSERLLSSISCEHPSNCESFVTNTTTKKIEDTISYEKSSFSNVDKSPNNGESMNLVVSESTSEKVNTTEPSSTDVDQLKDVRESTASNFRQTISFNESNVSNFNQTLSVNESNATDIRQHGNDSNTEKNRSTEDSSADLAEEFRENNQESPTSLGNQIIDSINNFRVMSPSAMSESSLLNDEDSASETGVKISFDKNINLTNDEDKFVKSTIDVSDIIGCNVFEIDERLQEKGKTVTHPEDKLNSKSFQLFAENDDSIEKESNLSSPSSSPNSSNSKSEHDNNSPSLLSLENELNVASYESNKTGNVILEINHVTSKETSCQVESSTPNEMNLDDLVPKSNCNLTNNLNTSTNIEPMDCQSENDSQCSNLPSTPHKKSEDKNEIHKSFKSKHLHLKSKKGSIKFKKKYLVMNNVNSKKKCVTNVLKPTFPEKPDNPVEPQLTEYAQYLGLQPTLKFKCCICAQIGFQSYLELREHQKHCQPAEGTKTTSDKINDTIDVGKSVVTTTPNTEDLNQTNFRITRKVYLCSACGTYYENWNLFLHMREVHKRYICLFCLGMFTMSYKLADHLVMTHDIQVESFETLSDFKQAFSCSYFISCTDCGKLFSELDNWCAHQCQYVCNVCSIKNGHLPRCPRSSFLKQDEISEISGNVSQAVKSSVKIFPSSAAATVLSNPSDEKNYDFASNFCCVDIAEVDHNQSPSKRETSIPIDRSGTGNNLKVSTVGKEEKVNFGVSSERKIDCVEKIPDGPVAVSEVEGINPPINSIKQNEDSNNPGCSNKLEKQVEKCRVATAAATTTRATTIVANERDDEMESESTPSSGDLKCNKEIPLCKEIVQNSTKELEPCDSPTVNESCQNEEFDRKSSEVSFEPQNHSNLSKIADMKFINNSIITDVSKPMFINKFDKSTPELGSKVQKEFDNNAQNTLKASVFDLDVTLPSEPDQPEDSNETVSKQFESNDQIIEADDIDSPSVKNQILNLANQLEPKINVNNNLPSDTESKSDISEKESEMENSNLEPLIEPQQILSDLSKMQYESDSQSCNNSNQAEGNQSEQNTLKICLKKPFKNDADINLNMLSNDTSDSDSNRLSMVIDSSANDNDKENQTTNGEGGCDDDDDNDDDDDDNDEPNAGEEMMIDYESDNAVDNPVDRNEVTAYTKESDQKTTSKTPLLNADGIVLASEDVPPLTLTLNGTLNSINLNTIVKECVRTSCTVCVYCNHALKIAVNGKQLVLHLLAEHRYTPIKSEDKFEKLVNILKNGLNELETVFFNTDSYDSSDKSSNLPYDGTFSCFQCPFWTLQHKDLYTHKRKMHQKTILLCVMCKSNFYSYSELLCHMCPGTYQPNDIFFRCCFCHIDKIPSAFRLMVHIRKIHHTCEICLDVSNDQQKLATHMWKHKLHHLCYRCGIAYRNKPDITRHLFWKHGTESVLCKKCLQKKWPHVYHFCIPPTSFVCEECNATFSRTVALRVHKRLHTDEKPYVCTLCEEKFISRKILAKHEVSHSVQAQDEKTCVDSAVKKENDLLTSSSSFSFSNKLLDITDIPVQIQKTDEKQNIEIVDDAIPVVRIKKNKTKKTKPVLDLTDLPPLNLSSESDSDTETVKPAVNKSELLAKTENEVELMPGTAETEETASERTNIEETCEKKEPVAEYTENERLEMVLADHDYCLQIENKESSNTEEKTNKLELDISGNTSLNNSACSPVDTKETSTSDSSPTKRKLKSPKKKLNKNSVSSSSSSSSDSDSSSCSCGPNCSCSSSSSDSSTSTSSDSDSSSPENRRKQEERRQKRRERIKIKSPKPEIPEPVNIEPTISVEPDEPIILESDLDTDVTLTDEDFYDEYPQQHANKVLAEKRDQLMLLASVAPTHTAPSSPVASAEETSATIVASSPKLKKKVRTKRKRHENLPVDSSQSLQLSFDSNAVQLPLPTTPSLITKLPNPNAKSFVPAPVTPSSEHLEHFSDRTQSTGGSGSESESKRLSKRRRVKNKFYGYSSDEENRTGESKPKFRLKKVQKVMPTPKIEPVQPVNISAVVQSSPMPLVYQPPTITVKPLVPPAPSVSDISKRLAAAYHRPPSPSSSSSDSDDDKLNIDEKFSEPPQPQHQSAPQPQSVPAVALQQTTEKNASLYCYCQCPYDEVSEMIACDGDNCTIEWFHFECVGIMVPPKGQWFCPDCRKKKDFSY